MTSRLPNPSIVTSALSLGVFSVFSMMLAMAGIVIITRHFSAEEFGTYVLVLVIASFLGQISTLGLELSISKFIPGAKDELSR